MSDAPRERLGVAEALGAVLAGAAPLDAEDVALADALGRVLARDAVSPVAVPPWDNSAMDGWAVRAGDVIGATRERPRRLRVVGAAVAGGRWDGTLGAGEAVRIATGAPVPAGADAVVRVEDADADLGADGAAVLVRDDRDARDRAPLARRNVRPRGEDIAVGAVAAAAGAVVTPAAVGVLASIGAARVAVTRRPRVAVLASGDELVMLERFDAVRAGERIVSSNSYAVAALVREAGGEPHDWGIVPDRADAFRARLGEALAAGCDVVLTTGGVSVGEHDYARDAVRALGGVLHFWRVRMRPGGPLAFGALGGPDGRVVPWLGLPGNPVSTAVTFELFARPLLRRLLGDARPLRRTLVAALVDPVATAAPLTHFLRATLEASADGRLTARLTGAQGSGLLTSVARAHGLVVVPESVRTLPAGALVHVIPLGDAALTAAATADGFGTLPHAASSAPGAAGTSHGPP